VSAGPPAGSGSAQLNAEGAAIDRFNDLLRELEKEAGPNGQVLGQIAKNLQAYQAAITDLTRQVSQQLESVDVWQGATKAAFKNSLGAQMDATQGMTRSVDNGARAIDELTKTLAATLDAAKRIEPPRAAGEAIAPGSEYPYWDSGNASQVLQQLVDLINAMAPQYQNAIVALDELANARWTGPRAPSNSSLSPNGAGTPKGAAGGGAKAPGGGAGGAGGAKTPAAGGAGSPSATGAAGSSDPSAAGDTSASDPGSTSDPNALPNDPNVNSPSLPNDPTVNVPNIPNTNVPQLAGNPSTIQLPPNSSTTPPSKIPDLNLPTGSSSAGGGAINLPSVLPPGTTPNQPATGGPSSPAPGTATAGGTAPKPGGLAGEPAAAAGAKTSGMPYLPPPMGGMGGGGRQGGGGVKPGTAEQAGGPELGGLGGPAGKPIEEIGVPARLRGRGAAARSARPTRPARPRRAGRGSAKGAAQASGPTVDDSGEVLDEQLWRVDPPAMSDE